MQHKSHFSGLDSFSRPRLTEPWTVEDRPVDEYRPLRIAIIGSGISGIIASIRLRQRITNLELSVYEKNDDIGGTWLENRYPGCACGMYFLAFSFLGGLHVHLLLAPRFGLTNLITLPQTSQHTPTKPVSSRTRNGRRSMPRLPSYTRTGSRWRSNTGAWSM